MKHTIAIDLGGTIIKIGLMMSGQMIARAEIKARSVIGPKTQLSELENAISQLLHTNQLSANDLLEIGFSFAGLVDSTKNIIISTNQKYNDGPDIDLVGWAKEKWNCPLYAENDALWLY